MALTIKTLVKMYMLFVIFQICINMFVVVVPVSTDLNSNNQAYMDWLSISVNGEINSEDTSQDLLTNFKSHLETANLFNEGVVNAFLGVLKVVGSIIWFVIELALSILFTPSLMFQIIFYNFIASSTYLFALSLLIDVSFYLTIFYIVFRTRVKG